MIRLEVATVLLQWAAGGLAFLWVTSRRREVGLGYGWLLRGTYMVMGLGAAFVGAWFQPLPARDAAAAFMALAAGVAIAVSVRRRRAGVRGQRERLAARAARVSAMTGVDRPPRELDDPGREFPPALDLLAPLIGMVGLVAAAIDAGDPVALSLVRTLVGAAFLGAVTDAMLLGHWYLVQPGLRRAPLIELVRWVGLIWPLEVLSLLWPPGMGLVLTGAIDDGFGGLLGWLWLTCALTTIGLVVLTWAALRERQYAAVMAATGLLYLAILTAFGTTLVGRAVLAGG